MIHELAKACNSIYIALGSNLDKHLEFCEKQKSYTIFCQQNHKEIPLNLEEVSNLLLYLRELKNLLEEEESLIYKIIFYKYNLENNDDPYTQFFFTNLLEKARFELDVCQQKLKYYEHSY